MKKPAPSLPASHVPDRMSKPYNPYASHSPQPQMADVPPSTAVVDDRKAYTLNAPRQFVPKPVAGQPEAKAVAPNYGVDRIMVPSTSPRTDAKIVELEMQDLQIGHRLREIQDWARSMEAEKSAFTPKDVAGALRQWAEEQAVNDPEASQWARYIAHLMSPL